MNGNEWNDASGDWQNLAGSDQSLRYGAIIRLIETHLNIQQTRILDVGCGSGLLASKLPRRFDYMGIEPSRAAIAKIQDVQIAHSIANCTAESFEIGGRRWDCVVFNEMLYYSVDPIFLLQKYADALAAHGLIIVSIFMKVERPGVKALLLSLFKWRRPISNVHCASMVASAIVRFGWLQVEELQVPVPRSEQHWRIWAFRPRS